MLDYEDQQNKMIETKILAKSQSAEDVKTALTNSYSQTPKVDVMNQET